MKESYVDMLKQELLDRKERSSLYSERAFARDLKVSSGFISLLFNGKRSLSPRTALKISTHLNWSEVRLQKFLKSVQELQFVANVREKPKLKFKLEEHELELDQFRLIANVNHFVVLEFIQSQKMISEEQILAKLPIDLIELDMILKRLCRLKMIIFEKKQYKASNNNRKLKGTPSEAIRNFHKQSLSLAQAAIDEQEFEKRELKSLILSVDPKKIEQSKKYIAKFVSGFNEKFGNKKNGEIYQMNIQLFSHFKNEDNK